MLKFTGVAFLKSGSVRVTVTLGLWKCCLNVHLSGAASTLANSARLGVTVTHLHVRRCEMLGFEWRAGGN